MFERFTDRARRVVVLAQENARVLGQNYIGTEHILLGLIREGENVGTQVLQLSGVDLGAVRERVIALVRDEGTDSEIERTDDYPLCPLCASPLADTLASRYISSPAQPGWVAVAFCSKCGRALGILP